MSEQAHGVVAADEAGKTLAAVVRRILGGLPWSRAKALCQQGRVLLDDTPALDPAARVQAGSRIRVEARAVAAPDRVQPEIAIVYVDREVVVVDKPAGLMSVPFEPGDTDTLVDRVNLVLRRRFGAGPPLRVVQRLDKDTTGILVFARTRRAERFLQQQFRRHDVQRRYLGLALGRVRGATVESMLVPDRGDGLRGSVRAGHPPKNARRALTMIEPLEVFEVDGSQTHDGRSTMITLVSCRLQTGRQHQIRIHLSESGHPLVGERVYVRDYDGPFLRGFEPGQGRVLLHAEHLGFLHPADGELRSFDAPLPPDFAGVLGRLRDAQSAGSGPEKG